MSKIRSCYLVTVNGSLEHIYSNLSKVWRSYLKPRLPLFTHDKPIRNYDNLYKEFRKKKEITLLTKHGGKNLLINIYVQEIE